VEQPRWDENDCLHELRALQPDLLLPHGRGGGRESDALRGSFTAITGRIGGQDDAARTAGVVTDTGRGD